MSSTLTINIIGGGICGLACALSLKRKGHHVTIYEANSELSEYGAGLQLFPNATRILYAWGLQDEFKKVVNEPEIMSVRRYSNDAVIGEIAQNPNSLLEYGFPQWQAYRPDLQRILADAVRKEGVENKFGHAVKSVDFDQGSMKLADGSLVPADLVIAADGIRSKTRKAFNGVEARAYKEFCFRAVVPREKMLRDPETAELMSGRLSLAWCGPGLAVLGYPVAGGELYNTLLSVPRSADAENVGRWGQPGDLNEVKEYLKDFGPSVKKIWSLVDECAKWTLGDVPPFPNYNSETGRFVLVGDAAHAIVPHSGQGAAMALEDAASLAEFLDPLTFPPDTHAIEFLPKRLAAYNSFRQPRMDNLRRMAFGNSKFLTMEDGPEQEQRDKLWAAMTTKWKSELGELGEEGVRERAKHIVPDTKLEDIRTPEGRMYVARYDTIGEARKAVAVLV